MPIGINRRRTEIADEFAPGSSAPMPRAELIDVNVFVAVFWESIAKYVRSSISEKLARRLTAALRGKG